MDLITLLVDEFDRETKRSRRALEEVPDNQRGWKPHDRSMAFGYLADMVAMIPMWITMIIKQDELDIAPKDGGQGGYPQPTTSAAYLAALDKAARRRARGAGRHDRGPPADALEAAGRGQGGVPTPRASR